MGKKLGIDLGTTNSCVSFVDETGVVRIIEPSEGGGYTTPSVVYFDPESNEAFVGSIAREEGALNPEYMIERVKDFMGNPNNILNINGQDYSPAAIFSLVLKKLIADAEEWLGNEEIEGAVITCPAYFDDAARAAIRIAGENVVMSNGQKLNVLQILDEPVAAALTYGETCHEDVQKTILVYDLGGGTFDATVIKMDFAGNAKNLKVIAKDGNHHLGGKDWDATLAEYVRNKFCELTGIDLDEMMYDPDQVLWFSQNIEKTKILLTKKESANLIPSFYGNKVKIEVTRELFDTKTESLLNQTIQLIDDMMDKKGLTIANDIDEIILVGGSTKMPQVSARLEAEYSKPITSYEPDKAVAMGAALVANGLKYIEQCDDEDSDSNRSQIIINIGNELPRHGWTGCSVGIEMYHRGREMAATLVAFGDTTPKFVSTKDLLQMKLGSKYNPHKEIVAVLYKYRSHMELVEISECFECAQVEFSNKWHLKNNSDIWFDLEYNDGWNNESDYLTIHYGHENLTEKKEVKWKKIGTIMG